MLCTYDQRKLLIGRLFKIRTLRPLKLETYMSILISRTGTGTTVITCTCAVTRKRCHFYFYDKIGKCKPVFIFFTVNFKDELHRKPVLKLLPSVDVLLTNKYMCETRDRKVTTAAACILQRQPCDSFHRLQAAVSVCLIVLL